MIECGSSSMSGKIFLQNYKSLIESFDFPSHFVFMKNFKENLKRTESKWIFIKRGFAQNFVESFFFR